MHVSSRISTMAAPRPKNTNRHHHHPNPNGGSNNAHARALIVVVLRRSHNVARRVIPVLGDGVHRDDDYARAAAAERSWDSFDRLPW